MKVEEYHFTKYASKFVSLVKPKGMPGPIGGDKRSGSPNLDSVEGDGEGNKSGRT